MNISDFGRHALGYCAVAMMLASCGGSQTQINPSGSMQSTVPSGLLRLAMRRGVPDAALPACKGQKTTKVYASLGAKPLSTKGGTLCVPRFKNWGGTMTYPGPTTSGVTASLISRTTPYSGPLWPSFPPGTPIFYIQFNTTNGDVSFGTKLPGPGDLAGKQLKAKKAYTVTADTQSGSLWDALGECYATAVDGKYGPDLPDVGGVFLGALKASGTHVVIEIIPGKYTTTKC
ncbi:MAG: hypothetical protein WCC84_01160 [Candidatus Cybelea sp.]